LHFKTLPPQGDSVTVIQAEAFLDISGMDTFDNWETNTMFPGRNFSCEIRNKTVVDWVSIYQDFGLWFAVVPTNSIPTLNSIYPHGIKHGNGQFPF